MVIFANVLLFKVSCHLDRFILFPVIVAEYICILIKEISCSQCCMYIGVLLIFIVMYFCC